MENTRFEAHIDPSAQTHSKRNALTHWASICATLFAALALAACASLGSGGTPEEQVRQRMTERWQALIKGEFSRAYAYATPGFRAVVTPDAFRNRFGGAVTWLGIEIIRVNCTEPKKCEAVLRLDFKPTLGQMRSATLSTHVDETWLFENGQWWFFQKV